MLILRQDMRSKGIGAWVLNEILKASRSEGKKLSLRVFKVNMNALRFYLREGWHIAAKEEAFYLLENSSS